jgi:hypothetical protein
VETPAGACKVVDAFEDTAITLKEPKARFVDAPFI